MHLPELGKTVSAAITTPAGTFAYSPDANIVGIVAQPGGSRRRQLTRLQNHAGPQKVFHLVTRAAGIQPFGHHLFHAIHVAAGSAGGLIGLASTSTIAPVGAAAFSGP